MSLDCTCRIELIDSPLRAIAGGFVLDNIPDTAILPSALHGLGLFATAPIPASTRLCALDGQVVSYEMYHALMDRLDLSHSARDYLFMEWNALPGGMLLARMFRTKYGYINHSRIPNTRLAGNPPELWTMQDIAPGEEILLDYRGEALPSAYLHGHGAQYL